MSQTGREAKCGYIDKGSFVSGASSSLPVCLSFALMFFSIGMLAAAQNISLFQSLFMTFSLFAVPLQALILDGKDLTLLSIALSAFIINFKFFLMSSKLVSSWKHVTFVKKMSLHFVCTSTYMVSAHEKNKVCNWSYYIGVSLPSFVTAIFAVFLGFLLWDLYPGQKQFLKTLAHIVLPVHFMCLTMKRKTLVTPIMVTVAGICITPLFVVVLGKNLLIFSWLVLAGIFLVLEEKLCGK